jgi:hypothetical protein
MSFSGLLFRFLYLERAELGGDLGVAHGGINDAIFDEKIVVSQW